MKFMGSCVDKDKAKIEGLLKDTEGYPRGVIHLYNVFKIGTSGQNLTDFSADKLVLFGILIALFEKNLIAIRHTFD